MNYKLTKRPPMTEGEQKFYDLTYKAESPEDMPINLKYITDLSNNYRDLKMDFKEYIAYLEEVHIQGLGKTTCNYNDVDEFHNLLTLFIKIEEIAYADKILQEYKTKIYDYQIDGQPEQILLAVVKASVASGSFDKFKAAAFKHDTILDETLRYANKNKINEDIVIKMVKLLVEDHHVRTTEYNTRSASDNGYFNLAEYLIDNGGEVKELTALDLYDVVSGDETFESFKFLMSRGAKVETMIANRVIDNDKMTFLKIKALEDSSNVYKSLDFLVENNITTCEYVQQRLGEAAFDNLDFC